jgi:hypothetical protein
MNIISGGIKNLLNTSVQLLNHPITKEGIKNIAGTVTCAFGIMEIYNIYQISQGRAISKETYSEYPRWVQVIHKIIIVCAKISLILSAGVSRPAVFLISLLTGCIFSTDQLDRVFGPNTIFAVNPWHPRHLVSILAILLALPSLAQSTYKGAVWTCTKIRQYSNEIIYKQETKDWLTDSKIRLMTLFNTITSRPTLHIGNQLGRLILNRA